MKKSKALTTLVVGLACNAFLISNASAYTQLKCNGQALKRSSNAVTMRLYEALSPDTEWSWWYSAISSAITKANANPSSFRFYKSTGDSSVALNNGQNEIWPTGDDIGYPAAAYKQSDCSKHIIKETDIIIRATGQDAWTNSTLIKNLVGFGGNQRSITGTVIHELGHVAGLGHTSDTYSIMGQDWSHAHIAGTTAVHYIGEDASRGLVNIYGAAGTIYDVSVSNMRNSGANGEYAKHVPTLMTTTSDTTLSTFRDEDSNLTGYRVSRGQKVKVQFSYENLGNAHLTEIDTDFYISTNPYITSSDTQIGSYIIHNLALDTVYNTFKPTLTIPSNLTSGKTYYLGVIMDGERKITEKNEANNYTYIPIKIR